MNTDKSRSEQASDKPARQDEEGVSSRITPVPASPAAVEEVLANVALYPFDTSVVTRDLALRHAEELDRLRTRLSEAEKESAAWKQAHEDLLCVRQQDIAALSAKLGAYPLGCEIADLIHRMQRGDYSKGTALTLCARWLEMCERKATHNDH